MFLDTFNMQFESFDCLTPLSVHLRGSASVSPRIKRLHVSDIPAEDLSAHTQLDRFLLSVIHSFQMPHPVHIHRAQHGTAYQSLHGFFSAGFYFHFLIMFPNQVLQFLFKILGILFVAICQEICIRAYAKHTLNFMHVCVMIAHLRYPQ